MYKDLDYDDKVKDIRSTILDLRKKLIIQDFSSSEKNLNHLDDGFNSFKNAPHWLPKAKFSRTETDLIAIRKNDQKFIFEDYFSHHKLLSIQTENGLLLKGSLLDALAGPLAPMQYTQSTNTQKLSIGEVSEIKGDVKSIGIEGNVSTLKNGDPVFQGDVIETFNDGSVGLVFIDKTTMSLSDGGKMVLDELVYDPSTGDGTFAVDMLEGAFSFVSGEIAKTGSEAMTVSTPVATLGIRGTTVAGKAAIEGNENSFTLLQDPGGTVGEISVTNNAGTQTLSQIGATTTLSSFNLPPPPPIILTPAQIQENYGTALAALPPTPIIPPQPEPQLENQDTQEQLEEEGEINEESREEDNESEEESLTEEEGESETDEEPLIETESEIETGEEILSEEAEQIENLELTDDAQEVFETALEEGLSPEEAMAAAAEASGEELPSLSNVPEENIIDGSDSLQEFLLPDTLSNESLNEDISRGNSLNEIRDAFSDEGGESTQNVSQNLFPGVSSGIYSNENIGSIGFSNPFSGSDDFSTFSIDVGELYDAPQVSGILNLESGLDLEYSLDLYGGQISEFGFMDMLSITNDYSSAESDFYFEDASLYQSTEPTSIVTHYTEEHETTETILGTDNAETIYGTDLAETIQAEGGNDTISAGGGNDVIKGGDGIDTMKGGGGDDQFYYGSTTEFYDIITDFGNGNDTLLFDATVAHNVYTRSGFLNDSSSSGSLYNIDSNGGVMPNVINFTINLSSIGYADKTVVADTFTNFVIEGSNYEDVSGTNDFLILTGDGTNSAIFLWQDFFNDHGMFANESDELSLVALLNNFDNDTLSGTEIMLTPPI